MSLRADPPLRRPAQSSERVEHGLHGLEIIAERSAHGVVLVLAAHHPGLYRHLGIVYHFSLIECFALRSAELRL
jgi:hypothetical protein